MARTLSMIKNETDLKRIFDELLKGGRNEKSAMFLCGILKPANDRSSFLATNIMNLQPEVDLEDGLKKTSEC